MPTDGLRDRMILTLHEQRGHGHDLPTCPVLADAVLAALAGEPGDPLERMAEVLYTSTGMSVPWSMVKTDPELSMVAKKYREFAAAALSVRWEHAAHTAARLADAERRAEHAESEHQVTQDRLADAATVNRGLRPALESAEAETGRLRIHLKAQRQEAWLHKTRADEADAAITALRGLRETLATSTKRLTRREITRQLDAALDAPALRALDSKEILSSSAEGRVRVLAEQWVAQAAVDQPDDEVVVLAHVGRTVLAALDGGE